MSKQSNSVVAVFTVITAFGFAADDPNTPSFREEVPQEVIAAAARALAPDEGAVRVRIVHVVASETFAGKFEQSRPIEAEYKYAWMSPNLLRLEPLSNHDDLSGARSRLPRENEAAQEAMTNALDAIRERGALVLCDGQRVWAVPRDGSRTRWVHAPGDLASVLNTIDGLQESSQMGLLAMKLRSIADPSVLPNPHIVDRGQAQIGSENVRVIDIYDMLDDNDSVDHPTELDRCAVLTLWVTIDEPVRPLKLRLLSRAKQYSQSIIERSDAIEMPLIERIGSRIYFEDWQFSAPDCLFELETVKDDSR